MTISKIDININYEKLFGDKWVKELDKILFSNSFYQLMLTLHQSYKEKRIYPNKHDIFKAFRLCDPGNLKIVIVGQDPYPDGRATGVAFGIDKSELRVPESLKNIQECIESEFYNGFDLDFDHTLKSWAKQGVLLLNKSLTVESNKIGSHSHLWHSFICDVIKTIDKNNSQIIFMFWGADAKKLIPLVSKNFNYSLKCDHPARASYTGTRWICSNFRRANEILDENFGENEMIKW